MAGEARGESFGGLGGGRRPSAKAHDYWVEALLNADARWLRRIHNLAGGPPDATMRALTWLGNSWTWWLHTAIVAAVAGLLPAAMLGGGSGAAALVAQAVKRSVRRCRPNVALLGFEASSANPDRFSFPSGHTAGAVGGAVAVAFVSSLLGGVFGLLAVGIAFSRMYLGAHYPLDIAAGVVVGAVSGWASAEVIEYLWPLLF